MPVHYETEGLVAVITLDRPEKRNALNPELVDGISNAWHRFVEGPERAALIRSVGDDFSVGADIDDTPADLWRIVPGLEVEIHKPVVTAVQGWVVGGGFLLAQMADICIASESARLLYPEAKIGLTGGVIASLAARIPHKVAMEFMLLGEPMSAARGYDVGIVNRVVPEDQLDVAALEITTALSERAPLVTAALKGFVDSAMPEGPSETAARTRRVLQQIATSSDFSEGVAAFRERRAPRFEGN